MLEFYPGLFISPWSIGSFDSRILNIGTTITALTVSPLSLKARVVPPMKRQDYWRILEEFFSYFLDNGADIFLK